MTGRTLQQIAEALERGGSTHSVEDVLAQVEAGEAQLHEWEDSVIVTEIHDAPRCRYVHLWLAAGKLEEVIPLSRIVLAWAKQMGCARATMAGRRGWEMVLQSEGWKAELTLMGRAI